MKKTLSEMSNEELWQLFPIILKPFNKKWKLRYEKESKKILSTLKNDVERITHIGSTAVDGLLAKPTIDILLEIKDNTNLQNLIKDITALGYVYSTQPQNPPPHMMFMKGYTVKGFKGQTFHLHVRYKGDWDEIYFRDYLSANKTIAKEYEKLKIELRKKYEFDRDGYTEAKTDFIKKIVNTARGNNDRKYY